MFTGRKRQTPGRFALHGRRNTRGQRSRARNGYKNGRAAGPWHHTRPGRARRHIAGHRVTRIFRDVDAGRDPCRLSGPVPACVDVGRRRGPKRHTANLWRDRHRHRRRCRRRLAGRRQPNGHRPGRNPVGNVLVDQPGGHGQRAQSGRHVAVHRGRPGAHAANAAARRSHRGDHAQHDADHPRP